MSQTTGLETQHLFKTHKIMCNETAMGLMTVFQLDFHSVDIVQVGVSTLRNFKIIYTM